MMPHSLRIKISFMPQFPQPDSGTTRTQYQPEHMQSVFNNNNHKNTTNNNLTSENCQIF